MKFFGLLGPWPPIENPEQSHTGCVQCSPYASDTLIVYPLPRHPRLTTHTDTHAHPISNVCFSRHRGVPLQRGGDMMRELENRALAEAKGASGLEPSFQAMEDTLGSERDLILAR
jgi:hypothetical protein